LEINKNYPFNPYKIYYYNNKFACNSYEYSNNLKFLNKKKIAYDMYLNNVYEKIKYKNGNIIIFFYNLLYNLKCKFFNNNNNINCFCCSSITCSKLWSPSNIFNDIILEKIEIDFIEKYSSELNYKYLVNIYNNLLYNSMLTKLPNEILDKILY